MPAATTIIIAREDFSIPGGEDSDIEVGAVARESRFFDLLREAKPDVVVLDLSRANGSATSSIVKIRRQSSVPILVVCEPGAERERNYRIAGAAECIASPVDVVTLNEVLQQIVRINRQAAEPPARETQALNFAGVTFKP